MKPPLQKTILADDKSGINIEIHGDPDAKGLVIVPGAMSDARAWRQVACSITAWPSVVVVNRRGRPPSGPLTDTYSVETEINDLTRVLDEIGGAAALFGWSYGGLITLLAANTYAVQHLIAYDPIMAPFAAHCLADLHAAHQQKDWDRSVEIVNQEISGFSADHVALLRANTHQWQILRQLSESVYIETAAINSLSSPDEFATQAARVDLIIGSRNMGSAPYGTSFEDVRQRIASCAVHPLDGQGHLAHIEAPGALARRIDSLARQHR